MQGYAFWLNNQETFSRYTMAEEHGIRKELKVTRVERDLGIQVSDDLKVSNQVDTKTAISKRGLGRLK